MSVNLDNLFDEPVQKEKKTKDTTTEVGLSIVNKTKASVVAIEDVSMKAVYDQYKNLMYAIDKSGSMVEPLVSDNVNEYAWPEDIKDHLRRYLSYGHLSEDMKELLSVLELIDLDELKKGIVRLGPQRFGINNVPSPTNTKMGLVKKAVGDLIDKRYNQMPDARIILMEFNQEAEIVGADKDSIKNKIAMLQPGGGTSIRHAVEEAIRYFEQYPSPVGVNHLVLVTDGEDWSAVSVADMVDKMKEVGLVLDYIYICSKTSKSETASEVAKCFTNICKQLGGEYVECSSPQEFEQKLFQASTRLCLPPGDM